MVRAKLLSIVVLALACAPVYGQQYSDGSESQPGLIESFRTNVLGLSPRKPQSKTSSRQYPQYHTHKHTHAPAERVASRPAPPAPARWDGAAESEVLNDSAPSSEDVDPPPAPTASRPGHSSRRRAAQQSLANPATTREDEPPAAQPIVEDEPPAAPERAPSPISSRREPSAPRRSFESERSQPLEPENTSPATAAAPAESGDRLLIARRSPQISIETSGPRRIAVGKEAAYRIHLNNLGEMPASDVVVLVSIPEWAEVKSAEASAGPSDAATKTIEGVQWKIASLPARSGQDLLLRIVPNKSQSFELGIRWTTAPASSQALVEVQEPKLQMAIGGPSEVLFGQQQIYKLTIMNPGTGDAEGVTLKLLPINPAEGGVATHRIGLLRAGATKTVEIELTARQAGRISIKADATADGGLKASAVEEVVVRKAQLDVAVVGPKAHYAGAPVRYEVRVKNPGDASAEKIRVVAELPREAERVSPGAQGEFDSAQRRIVWTLDRLSAGSEQTLGFECVLRAAGANRFEATASASGELNATSQWSTQAMAFADLVLDVSDSPGPVPVGQDMTYEIRIRNRGSSAAEAVDVVAFFSQGLEPVAVEGGAHELRDGAVIFKPLASIAASAETVYKIKARAAAAGNHRIRVELDCKSLGTRLTSEDTTLFYGDDLSGSAAPTERGARQPASTFVR